jgi:hypothetical protein
VNSIGAAGLAIFAILLLVCVLFGGSSTKEER